MTKKAIPVLQDPSPDMRLFSTVVKANLDEITGKGRGMTPIASLDSGATLAQVISKINEILTRIQ